MGFGWFWCVNVYSSLVKQKITIVVSDVSNGGGYVGTESVSESLYLLFNFVVSIKLLPLKKKQNKKQNWKQRDQKIRQTTS